MQRPQPLQNCASRYGNGFFRGRGGRLGSSVHDASLPRQDAPSATGSTNTLPGGILVHGCAVVAPRSALVGSSRYRKASTCWWLRRPCCCRRCSVVRAALRGRELSRSLPAVHARPLTDVRFERTVEAGGARALPRDRRDRLRALPLGARPQPAGGTADAREGVCRRDHGRRAGLPAGRAESDPRRRDRRRIVERRHARPRHPRGRRPRRPRHRRADVVVGVPQPLRRGSGRRSSSTCARCRRSNTLCRRASSPPSARRSAPRGRSRSKSRCAARDLDDPLERGIYLIEIADCMGCHTAWEAPTNPGFGGGGNPIERFGERAFSANLTPDPTGIGAYTEGIFRGAIRSGRGGTLHPADALGRLPQPHRRRHRRDLPGAAPAAAGRAPGRLRALRREADPLPGLRPGARLRGAQRAAGARARGDRSRKRSRPIPASIGSASTPTR